MTTPAVSILSFVFAAFLGALGQFLYKSATENSEGGVVATLLTPRAIGGIVCYIAVMYLFVFAYKKGGSLAVLYPIYASTFIWAAFIAWWAYQRPVLPIHMAGMALIVGGMYLMGR